MIGTHLPPRNPNFLPYLSRSAPRLSAEPEVRLNYDTGGDNSLTGFDRFGRVVDHVWEQYGGQQPAAVDRFQYGYDSAGNRVWRKNVVAHGESLAFDEVYGLDDLGRLIAAERGYLQSIDPVSLTARAFEQEWGLDGTGNWAEFNEDLDGTGWDLQQTREHNAANEVTGATDWAAPAHDRAGNMTAMPKPASPADALDATYDAWNRLVDVSEGGVLIAKFSYDAAGRRILQQLADAQEPDQYIHYFHSGQQVVETRATNLPLPPGEGWGEGLSLPDPAQLDPAYQFVWSPRYIDALILRDQYDGQGQLDPGARLFYLADANHNVTALVGLVETEPDVFEWQVVERYVYSPYGHVTIYTPDWSATRAESAFDNTTLYTGREFDPSTGLYYYRARYYHAQLGQFISRDPIGYEAGDVNLYRYVGNRPLDAIDPTGQQSIQAQTAFLATKVGAAAGAHQKALQKVTTSAEHLKHALSNPKNLKTIQAAQQRLTADMREAARKYKAFKDCVDFFTQWLKTPGVTVSQQHTTKVNTLVDQAATSTTQGAQYANRLLSIDPNRLNHIFNRPGHNLDTLVRKSGDIPSAFMKVQDTIREHVVQRGITGHYTETVTVAGEEITVRGVVIDGIVKIGTFWK